MGEMNTDQLREIEKTLVAELDSFEKKYKSSQSSMVRVIIFFIVIFLSTVIFSEAIPYINPELYTETSMATKVRPAFIVLSGIVMKFGAIALGFYLAQHYNSITRYYLSMVTDRQEKIFAIRLALSLGKSTELSNLIGVFSNSERILNKPAQTPVESALDVVKSALDKIPTK